LSININQTSNKMNIYFYCPIANEPIGAFKEIYKHAQCLAELGYNAFVVHNKKHKESWFRTNVDPVICPLKDLKSITTKDDVLVILEVSTFLLQYVNCQRVIVFNQAPFRTFHNWGLATSDPNPYKDTRISAVITVSANAINYIQHLNLKVPIYRIHCFADQSLFSFTNYENKRDQIALMTRRNFDDIEQVIQLLYLRSKSNYIDRYKIKYIEKRTELQTARTLKKSKFFLHFGYQEGFGIPVLEAMMCGCVVIGYGGFGGDELYKNSHSRKVPTSDIITYVQEIESLIKTDIHKPEIIKRMSEKATTYANKNYNKTKYYNELKQIWSKIMGS